MQSKIGFLKLGFAAVALMLCSGPAYADLIFDVQSVSVGAGTTGDSLEVSLANTGPSSVSIGGFTFEIQSSDPAITFTGAFTSTTVPYIFAGNSLFGPETDTQTTPTLIASDFAAVGSTALAAGGIVGLGEVFFDVSAGAVGHYTISFAGGAAGNSLAGPPPNYSNVPINVLNSGTITISTIPEPSSLLLMLTGTAALVGLVRRRRA